jgi:hypothetical protein
MVDEGGSEAMNDNAQLVALAELDEKLYVIHKPFGYYRKDAHGYTTLEYAWRVTHEEGMKHIGGRPTDYDRVVLEPAPTKPYLTSYDAIIPLVVKHVEINDNGNVKPAFVFELCRLLKINFVWSNAYDLCTAMLKATPAQLAEALLRAVGKWKE